MDQSARNYIPCANFYIAAMLVFIDESGDPGFKIERGSSPVFVTAMVIFQTPEAASEASQRIIALRKSLGIKPEFKFNKCASEKRDAFFSGIKHCDFTTRAVVVKKNLIYSNALRTVKESFYKFFVRKMMENDGAVLKDAKVVIDGSGDRLFKQQFRSYMRKHIDAGCVKEWDLKDSARDPLIQLADMAAGSIARSYKDDRADKNRWRAMLNANGQLQNVWEFK